MDLQCDIYLRNLPTQNSALSELSQRCPDNLWYKQTPAEVS